MIRDPRLRALVECIEYDADPDGSVAPEDQPTSISITTARGTFSATQTRHRGYPTEGIEDRVREKFARNASFALGADQTAALLKLLEGLEDSEAAEIADLLVPRVTAASAGAAVVSP